MDSDSDGIKDDSEEKLSPLRLSPISQHSKETIGSTPDAFVPNSNLSIVKGTHEK